MLLEEFQSGGHHDSLEVDILFLWTIYIYHQDVERRLAVELVYGVIRYRGRLDWILKCYLKKRYFYLKVSFFRGFYDFLGRCYSEISFSCTLAWPTR